jgi:uncharacterized repeat protein (TIGR01451 family)
MNKLMSFLKRHAKKMSLFAGVAVTVAATAAIATAGFGPDRPTKVYNGPGTPGFDYVTFNSFTNVPNIGDERNFLTGKIAGADGGFYDPMTKLRNEDEILMRVYVHNNADPKHNASGVGVAKNTKVRVELPSAATSAQSLSAKAYISADNAQPQTIFDTLDMKAENGGFFSLQYVPGSATVTSNEGTSAVSDSIVTTGVNFGDEKGCFEYVKLVTYKVKVKMPRYSVAKTVRLKGQGPNDWKESLTVKSGQEVEWRIEFKNIGSTELKSVKIVDEVPAGANPVSNSVKLYNGNYPNGYTYPNTAIQAGGKQVNVDIGNYLPNINAFVLFTTKVEQECGVKSLVNKAFATPAGYGAVVDDAKVTVEGKNCVTNKSYECTALDVVNLGGNKYQFKVNTAVSGGATVNKYTYNFGDGSEELSTTNATVEHQYAAPGSYDINVRVLFNVGSEQKDARCTAQVTIPTTPETPVEELPNTGAGSVVAGIFGTSALVYGVYAFADSRRALKNLK